MNKKGSLAVVSLALLVVVGIGVAQNTGADELQKDQTFEAIMVSVRTDQPQASGFAKIMLPSPRWFPLNRFGYVRVEAEGLVPGKSHNIHLHGTRTDTTGQVSSGCFAGGPVLVNLRGLVSDANGKGVSASRIVLDSNYVVFEDAVGRVTNNAVFNRASLTTWYVQYHVPVGETGAGQPMACGEVTLAGFDRGVAFR
jgi:hypothetical protein